jgi:SAM-dependent methyltransferase
MKLYYSERAKEYEKVYFRDDPIRQQEQLMIRYKLESIFRGKNVLEVACGTGFWTQFGAEVAKHITAIDFSNEVLNIAREKNYSKNNVQFTQGDAYQLSDIAGNFEGGYANFWFSHIPKNKITDFLMQLHERLGKDSAVFITDNIYMNSIGGTLVKKDSDENTYKIRTLENGMQHEILKNYYDKKELDEIFSPYSNNLEIHIGQCFWWLSYTIK